ncbi:MAG: Mur ligase family protein [Cyclonatronaceae bacterium]
MSFKKLSDVHRFLDGLPSFQVKGAAAARLGLERIRAFCKVMGHPEREVPCIHVAGTNGKGSVSAMLALAYEHEGYRCGLYSSPHLEQVNERIRINRQPIPDIGLLAFFQSYGEELMRADLSYFEITTAAAFWWFAREGVDMAILETGLGGRLDATNVVLPEISIITSIAHDHQAFLGRNLARIAREKGGIIKPGRPLILGNVPASARKVLESMAAQTGSDVLHARQMQPRHLTVKNARHLRSIYRLGNRSGRIEIRSDLSAPVHRWNLAVAYIAIRQLQEHFPVSERRFSTAFERTTESGLFRARFERITSQLPWYFDGAHNPEAVRELMQTIRRQDWQTPPVMVLSVMKDKAQKKMLEPFSVFEKNYYYRLETERAADIALITPFLDNIKSLPPNEDEVMEIFAGFTKQVVIFTGSFYFYGVVKRWISRIIKAD